MSSSKDYHIDSSTKKKLSYRKSQNFQAMNFGSPCTYVADISHFADIVVKWKMTLNRCKLSMKKKEIKTDTTKKDKSLTNSQVSASSFTKKDCLWNGEVWMRLKERLLMRVLLRFQSFGFLGLSATTPHNKVWNFWIWEIKFWGSDANDSLKGSLMEISWWYQSNDIILSILLWEPKLII